MRTIGVMTHPFTRGAIRRGACLAAVGALSTTSLGGNAAASGAGGPLRDGNWSGTLAVGATIDFSREGVGLIASGSGNGTFDLTLAGGEATGGFTLGFASAATLESAGGTGDVVALGGIDGEVQGTASGPILAPLVGHADVTGTVTASGMQMPIDIGLDVGPEEMTASTMTITSSSCSVASGTWAQEMRDAAQAAGAGVTSFQGSWAATFAGASSSATNAALDDMLADGEALLLQWLGDGTFDVDALEQVLIAAEHFAATGPVDDGCDAASSGGWASPLAGLVDRLLTAAANSPATTAEILRFGVAAGLRTNTLPSVGDDSLEASLMAKASELLATAIAVDAQADIWLLAVTADSMGWTDISAAAAAAKGN